MTDSSHTTTVEVPIHVCIEFDDVLQVDKDTDVSGLPGLYRMLGTKEPTDEFKQAVREQIESERVTVNRVYAANGWSVSGNDR